MWRDGDPLPESINNEDSERRYKLEQQQRKLENAVRKAKRKVEGLSDPENVKKAKAELRDAQKQLKDFIDKVNADEGETILKRDYSREKVYSDIPENRIDNSGGSGIIKENNKSKSVTVITDKAIESVPKVNISGYTDEQCAIIQNQHKELLEYSRKNNNNNEVAFILDSSLENRKEFMGSDDKIDFGRGFYGSEITVLHNHPRNSSFSNTDIVFFGSNTNVKTLTIVKNNEKVEYLTKSKTFDEKVFKLEYDRLCRKLIKNGTNSEMDKFIKTLLNKTKSGVIWSERI